jgi:hypothetical protein
MLSCRASHGRRRAVWGAMIRRTSLVIGVLAGLLLAGCRTTSRSPGRKEAIRANAISNKHILSEEPTLERPAPRVTPDSETVVH